MIELITKYNIDYYRSEIEQMFRLRYKIFVEEKGWDLPMAKDGLEIDQFDHEDAAYLIAFNDDRKILGSVRFTPTEKPNMLQDVFPHLVEGEVPVGPMIWETSRGFSTVKDKREVLTPVLSTLMVGMVEVGLLVGANKMNIVLGTSIYPTFLNAGWGVTPLGFPHVDKNGDEILSASLTIDSLALHNVRRVRNIRFPILRYNNFEKDVA